MGEKTYEFLHDGKGRVRLKSRQWDGIDRAEHETVALFTPDEADVLIREITRASALASVYIKEHASKQLDELRRQRSKLDSDIAEVVKELKRKGQ